MDDPTHHGPRPTKPRDAEWLPADLIIAVVGVVGTATILILVATGVIHQ